MAHSAVGFCRFTHECSGYTRKATPTRTAVMTRITSGKPPRHTGNLYLVQARPLAVEGNNQADDLRRWVHTAPDTIVLDRHGARPSQASGGDGPDMQGAWGSASPPSVYHARLHGGTHCGYALRARGMQRRGEGHQRASIAVIPSEDGMHQCNEWRTLMWGHNGRLAPRTVESGRPWGCF